MSSTITGSAGSSIAAQCTGPDAGDAVTAASVRNGLQSIENDVATVKSGTYTTSATVTHTGAQTFSANVTFSSGHTVTHAGTEIFSGQVSVSDRLSYPGRTVLSDASHTIDVTSGTYVLPNAPASTRAITVSTSVGPPMLGERIRIVVPGLQHVTGPEYHVFRASPTGQLTSGMLCAIWSSASAITYLPIAAEFEFGEGLVLSVTGTASGTGGAVKLTVALPAGALGNPTDSLATGDQVAVASVGGTTEANGTWTITVNDSSHITLTGTTYANAYTSGGTTQITPGVWRLGMNSGTSYDGSAKVGVLADSCS